MTLSVILTIDHCEIKKFWIYAVLNGFWMTWALFIRFYVAMLVILGDLRNRNDEFSAIWIFLKLISRVLIFLGGHWLMKFDFFDNEGQKIQDF